MVRMVRLSAIAFAIVLVSLMGSAVVAERDNDASVRRPFRVAVVVSAAPEDEQLRSQYELSLRRSIRSIRDIQLVSESADYIISAVVMQGRYADGSLQPYYHIARNYERIYTSVLSDISSDIVGNDYSKQLLLLLAPRVDETYGPVLGINRKVSELRDQCDADAEHFDMRILEPARRSENEIVRSLSNYSQQNRQIRDLINSTANIVASLYPSVDIRRVLTIAADRIPDDADEDAIRLIILETAKQEAERLRRERML